MSGVRIVDMSFAPLLPGPYPPPGEIVPLSFLDMRWIHLQQPVQNLLLYPDSTLSSSSLHLFKTSLTQALSFFHPLAGKLTYRHATDQLVIDSSSPDCGVSVIEAESDLDIHRLINEETIDIIAFTNLVPSFSMDKLPVPVSAIQITKFVGGGVSVGAALHHAVMDGIGFWRFMETWAAICRDNGAPFQSHLQTSHDRDVILHPHKEVIATRFMKLLAPDLPQLPQAPKSLVQDRLRLTRHTFTLDHTAIKFLKQRACTQSDDRTIFVPSASIAIAAHVWVSLAKAKRLPKENDATSLWLLFDLRAYLKGIKNDVLFTGNCIRGVPVKSSGQDLTAPQGLASACLAISHAVKAVKERPLDGVERWPDEFKNRPTGMNVMVAGSARWGVYETDFGWGRPGRVELVSMNFDGEVSMLAGRDKGSVQATVALAGGQMEVFEKAFIAGLAQQGQSDYPGKARL
ncbi:HXXXD-type acyl-transferase family protein [Rhynchospora pubera]|uniref:HXXXD-type acyl-transferase family protein n=1 Tax=Rhynchospora pubera TaxID=906938 RepID=A0AAV8GDH0_9POAL|nr:HXXXD-type acyl-transferase family protein [Rhynchospora pubera]